MVTVDLLVTHVLKGIYTKKLYNNFINKCKNTKREEIFTKKKTIFATNVKIQKQKIWLLWKETFDKKYTETLEHFSLQYNCFHHTPVVLIMSENLSSWLNIYWKLKSSIKYLAPSGNFPWLLKLPVAEPGRVSSRTDTETCLKISIRWLLQYYCIRSRGSCYVELDPWTLNSEQQPANSHIFKRGLVSTKFQIIQLKY